MNDVEQLLRRFQPVRAPEKLRNVQPQGSAPEKERPHYSRWVPLIAAAAGLFGILFYVVQSSPPMSPSRQETAEETFSKIEELIKKARTVKVSFRVEGTFLSDQKTVGIEKSGTIILKEGNKASMAIKERVASHPKNQGRVENLLVSDGIKLTSKVTLNDIEADRKERDAPKDLNTHLAMNMIRIGDALSLIACIPGTVQGPDLKEEKLSVYEVADFKVGEEDQGAKTLLYKIGGTLFDAKIWYEPKTYKILKRTLRNSVSQYTETYDEFTLNAEIPDDNFKLPEK